MRPIAAVILAAGRGERMNSDLPKVLHRIAGSALIEHVIDVVRTARVKRIGVVIGTQSERVRSLLLSCSNGTVEVILQKQRLGTGHAVLQAEKQFQNWPGDLLVLPADAPCVRSETLRDFIAEHQKKLPVASILTSEVGNPAGYGRIIRRGDNVIGIREELDASESERKITEINSGIYVFNSRALFRCLRSIAKNEKKKEYYLTDVIEAFHRSGEQVRGHRIDDRQELLGVNTRRELAVANQILTERELERHSKAGVTILNPAQTIIAKGVKIGRDTVVHPFTWIESGVTIGRRCEIGPFAKIRSGSKVDDDVIIGSFVEVVRSRIGAGSFVKHLTYLGDAWLGKQVNVGAGTITANFDGKHKNRTVVQDRAFLGCDTILVAPVKVGRGAKTGAGAVVPARKSVPAGKVVVGVPAEEIRKRKKQR